MPLCLEGLLYKWRRVARRPPQHVLVLDTGKNLAHLRLLVVMHGYEVVDVVEVHRPGSPRRRCDAFAFARCIDDSDTPARVLRPWLSSLDWGQRSQAPPALACHRPMQAAFLEGLLCWEPGAQKSASPRVSKLPFARRVSEQSILSSPAARGKGAITRNLRWGQHKL